MEFPPGVTALVGPNGSGKSNVVDAIRWCLGEQSARDLRGYRAEDVIHAGARRVLGSAEVVLTFDDAHHDLGWSELAVSRRIYRSGESEYLLNRDRLRLRDVQASLQKLGIDNPRFVVVNQGMADSLLSATPLERRALLEQAAGLSAYRQRREEAAQKLAAAEQNVQMIEIVLAELEPRLRALRKQARAVEERDDLAKRLRTLLEAWYAHRWAEVGDELALLRTEVQQAQESRLALSEELRSLEERAEAGLEAERRWQSEVEKSVAALHHSEREYDAGGHECDRLSQKLEAAGATLITAQQRLTDLQRERGVVHDGLAAACRDLESAEAELEALAAQLQQRLDLTNALRETTVKSDAGVREIEDERRRLEHELRALEGEHERLQSMRIASDRRVAEIESRIRAGEQEIGDVARLRETAEAASRAARQEEDAAQAELGRASEAAEATRRRSIRLRRLRERVSIRASGLASELQSARRTEDSLAAELNGAAVTDLRVSGEWEQGVASALGEWALISPETDIPPGLLEWRRALECRLRESLRWADAHVSGNLPAMLVTTVLVESAADAERLWGAVAGLPADRVGSPPLQIATRRGEIYSALGRRGEQRDDRPARLLASRRKVRELAQKSELVERRHGRLAAAETHAVSAARHADSRMAADSARFEAARRAVAQRAVDAETVARREREMRRELGECELARRTVAAERERAAERMEDVEQRLNDLKPVIALRAERAEQAATVLADGRRALREEETAVRELAGRRDVLVAQREALLRIVEVRRRDTDRVTAETERIESEIVRLVEEIEATSERQRVAALRLRDLTAVRDELSDRLEAARAAGPAKSDAAPLLRDLRSRTAEAVAHHERLSARCAELSASQTRLAQEIEDDLEIAAVDLPEAPTSESPSVDEVRRLRARAARYAEFDPAVIAEYRELEQRRSFLTEQVGDLRATSEGLIEILALADREMRERYRAALRSVGDEFSRVFHLMLRGGDARLEQVDDDGGIEVRATLPGRRARSSAAFSGGERALVASSLLFGVLRIRPTPFCVLDEVDAALDETNVDRYLCALQDIAARTQVLVVTHNRATMAAANVLYGLTMDSEGVSRALSLRLDEYEAAG